MWFKCGSGVVHVWTIGRGRRIRNSIAVQVWIKCGSSVMQAWLAHCPTRKRVVLGECGSPAEGPTLVQMWFTSGSTVVQVGFKCGSTLVQVWFKYGSSVVRVWFMC
eukprot:2241690-Pyramimonas_sp.AAC.1